MRIDEIDGASLIEEAWFIATDPAHIIGEVVFALAEAAFIFLFVTLFIKRFLLPKWHEDFDRAHDISHHSVVDDGYGNVRVIDNYARMDV